MSTRTCRMRRSRVKRGVIAVQVAVFMVMLLAVAALTIDVGAMFNTRADLQRAADAAALAGASAYNTDAMMTIRMGTGGAATLADVVWRTHSRVNVFANLNPSLGTTATQVDPADILTGWINVHSASEALHPTAAPNEYNAVQVTVRRSTGEASTSNGPLHFFFAPVFGTLTGDVSASAVAIFDDRFAGVTVSEDGAGLLPFTIHEDAFASELAAGGDQYSYDHDFETVNTTPDGIREIRLYPYPLSGSGYEEGDGNFGVLNIGTGNQGVDAEVTQIRNGVTAADFEMEIGTSDLTLLDDSGQPVTYDITGSPGLEVALKAAISDIVGREVGFFLHDNVVLSGSNAIYTITQIRYGRVMDVRLTGAPNQRGLFVQPTSYAGSEIHIDPQAPSSGGLVGRIVLAR